MILDASVLVKLVITEPGSEQARDIVRRAVSEGEVLACPDIALAEALNALWKQHALLKRTTADVFKGAVEDLLRLWRLLRVWATEELAVLACELALKVRLPIYDALYLALAEKAQDRLFTFDEKLEKAARSLGIRVLPP